MGAKFTPSIGNLFMSEWEDRVVFSRRKAVLLFYRRFIDDLFFICVGNEESLKSFADDLNHNENNISLQLDWSAHHVNYLDVTVSFCENHINTKVFFKTTDQNRFLPTYSGHHPLWLKNIPKGQCMRVWRNCSFESDFVSQSLVLKECFREKGYTDFQLDRAMEEVIGLTQDSCLEDRIKLVDTKHEYSFISSYHAQYKEVEEIFCRYWKILTMDKVLPSSASFIYRRSPSLTDRLVLKVLDSPSRPQMFWEMKGFYAGRRCISFKQISTPIRGLTKSTSSANGGSFLFLSAANV